MLVSCLQKVTILIFHACCGDTLLCAYNINVEESLVLSHGSVDIYLIMIVRYHGNFRKCYLFHFLRFLKCSSTVIKCNAC